ncbi:DNA mismatch repair protein MutS [Hirschia litorea]|uniref:DNA mismatch repair protein MutS n=1 Tax=Hirschia litorea TaxID=1199156 RepID=A0ABW2IN57_9PROT
MSKAPSPFLVQYLEIKERHNDALLFFRMGDFYELFFEDAQIAAAALDITLTARGQHSGEPIPMAGVPFHAAEGYLARLIRLGHRVAVCEQLESPEEAKKRGYKSIVRRDVVRIVTPGTLTEDSLLDARASNILVAIGLASGGSEGGVALADVSTGRFEVFEAAPENFGEILSSLSPKELLLSESAYARPLISDMLESLKTAVTPRPAVKADKSSGERQLKDAMGVKSLDAYGGFSAAELSACALLLDYLHLTQAGEAPRLDPPKRYMSKNFMSIDPSTRTSLEIDVSAQGGRKGSLLHAIDCTITAPGARRLADNLARPLIDLDVINSRLDAVGMFVSDRDLREEVRDFLKQSADIERARMRLQLGRGGPKDLLAIASGLAAGAQAANRLRAGIAGLPVLLEEACQSLDLKLQTGLGEFSDTLSAAIHEDAPVLARDGGFVREGYDPELDEVRSLRDDSRKIIAGLQAKYAEKTGISSLKIRHNKVLGYFIDVTARNADAMQNGPHAGDFIHRQTIASAMRFTTVELGELDGRIARADGESKAREMDIFNELVTRANNLSQELRTAADAMAAIDVAAALAHWAEDVKAVRPQLDDSTRFNAVGARHPVVEAALRKEGEGFTANDCILDADGKDAPRLMMVTGPNMAGKSTYLRQNALLAILAQAGCFVPAQQFNLGLVDRVFSRVGASDDLSRGRSTFMVEMIETAAILNQAGPRAFVILDEVGRGTATYDGLAIAWAAVEHLHEKNKCRAIFATHYHELTDLAEKLSHAGNASLRAKDWQGDLVFLHDVKPGAADRSYGVQVAKLAGMPRAAVKRAEDVLLRLEGEAKKGGPKLDDLPLFAAVAEPAASFEPSAVELLLQDLDVDGMSPREALDMLYKLKLKLGS